MTTMNNHDVIEWVALPINFLRLEHARWIIGNHHSSIRSHDKSKIWEPLVSLIVGMLLNDSVIGFRNADCIRVEQQGVVVLFIRLVWDLGGAATNCLWASNAWVGRTIMTPNYKVT